MKYIVTATIRSGNIDQGQPVDVNWYRGEDHAAALAAMVSAAAHKPDDTDTALPERMQYRTLSVRLDITEEN